MKVIKAVAYLVITCFVIFLLHIVFQLWIGLIGSALINWLWSFNGVIFAALVLIVGGLALPLLQPAFILYFISTPVVKKYLLSLTTSKAFALNSAWVISILMGVNSLFGFYRDSSFNSGASKIMAILMTLTIIQTSIFYPLIISNKQNENSL